MSPVWLQVTASNVYKLIGPRQGQVPSHCSKFVAHPASDNIFRVMHLINSVQACLPVVTPAHQSLSIWLRGAELLVGDSATIVLAHPNFVAPTDYFTCIEQSTTNQLIEHHENGNEMFNSHHNTSVVVSS